MITTDVFDDRIEMRAFGDYSLSDCYQLEDVSTYRIRFGGPIKLLLDFRDMSRCSLDAMIEQMRFARQHSADFRQVAVLTDDQWVTWGAWLSQFLLAGEVQVFDDEESAREWLLETTPTEGSTALH